MLPLHLSARRLAASGLSCILLAAAAMVANASGQAAVRPPALTPADVARIESALVMPKGAESLDRYVRYYSVGQDKGGAFVYGTFVRAGAFQQFDGEPRVLIVDESKHPPVSDGGCLVVRMWYSIKERRTANVSCNGEA
jgi:hypothetical protein